MGIVLLYGCFRTLNNRINKIHERALRLVYNDEESSFENLLLKDNSFTIHERNIQTLAIELYKVVNHLSPKIENSRLLSSAGNAPSQLLEFDDASLPRPPTTDKDTEFAFSTIFCLCRFNSEALKTFCEVRRRRNNSCSD